MAATRFFDSATSYSTSNTLWGLSHTVTEFQSVKPKAGQSTQLLPVLQIYFRCDDGDFISQFLPIIVNFTTFWAISDTFETTSGFRLLLPVHKFRLVSPDFHIGSISNRFSAILQPYGPEYGKKERPVGPSGQTGSRNMAEASFSDSATPTSYSTSYTLWSLSRTVTAPPGENFNISPL